MFEQPATPFVATTEIEPSPESLKALGEVAGEGAIAIVDLVRFGPGDDVLRYRRYAERAGPAVERAGGKLLFHAPIVAAAKAGGLTEWDAAAVVEFPSARAFLELQHDAEYEAAIPDRRAGLAQRLVYVFRPAAPIPELPATDAPFEPVAPPEGDEIFVVNLLRFRGRAGLADYARYGEVVGPMIGERKARLVLDLEPVLPLVSDGYWHHFVLVRYPSLQTLMQMVGTDEWRAANEHRERGLHATIAFPTQPERAGRDS
jgi:uncharacterized protein (DUF1330 family)